MMEKQIPSYTGMATAEGGRDGKVKTSDGALDIRVSPPVEFGGSESGHTNPEQLLAAGWAACFDNAIILIAKGRRVEISSSTRVEVTLGPLPNGNMGLSAKIHSEIQGVDENVAIKIMETAHKVCPFSVATKGNVETEITLNKTIKIVSHE